MEPVVDRTRLGRVLVLGLGNTAVAVTRYLTGPAADRVDSVAVVGGAKSSDGPAAEKIRAMGATVVTGTDDVEGTFDLCVASPGVSEFSPLFASAAKASARTIGEPELVFEESPENWIAITGTNGKTTTTALTCELLRAASMDAVAVGNIGTNLADALADGRPEGQWYVAELSSFQLATTCDLHPRVACLLNITPDHGEWHLTFDNYVAAKRKVFANLDAADLAVLDVDDPLCASIADDLDRRGLVVMRVSAISVPASPNRAYVGDGRLTVELDGRAFDLGAVSDLLIEGPHNVANALTAASAALFAGAPVPAVAAGLAAFSPLEHRIEPVATIDGVRYVNDSKATNTDATVTAARSFAPGTAVVLVGGHDKGGDLDEFAQVLAERAKAVVAYGEAAERLGAAVAARGGAPVTYAPHMAEALEAARALAVPGDVVLLSPACSSFDEFSGFEERGRVFKGLVRGDGGVSAR